MHLVLLGRQLGLVGTCPSVPGPYPFSLRVELGDLACELIIVSPCQHRHFLGMSDMLIQRGLAGDSLLLQLTQMDAGSIPASSPAIVPAAALSASRVESLPIRLPRIVPNPVASAWVLVWSSVADSDSDGIVMQLTKASKLAHTSINLKLSLYDPCVLRDR